MSTKRCYYEVLGCERAASSDDLRRAYKKLALKFHPDRNPDDQAAEHSFKEATEAYQILCDDEKRRIYDQFGHAGLEGGGGVPGVGDVFSHMQDLFAEMFSGGFGFSGRGRQRGADLRVQERITLSEAAFGCKREVHVHAPATCDTCGGIGAEPGSKPETCGPCRGTGQVSTARGFVMFSAPCGRCGGRGHFIPKPCGDCRGEGVVEKDRTVTVTFPAGVDAGQRLRVQGRGAPGPNGAPPGDLYVDVDLEDDPRFERDGADLITRVSLSFAAAALGTKVRVPTLEPGANGTPTTTELDIPAGTQPGDVFTLRGQGVPRLGGRGRGTLIVAIEVGVPKKVSKRARELLLALDAELGGAGDTTTAQSAAES